MLKSYSNGVWLVLSACMIVCVMSEIKSLNKTIWTTKTWETTNANNNLKPSEWLSIENLNSLPALNEISWDYLEKLPTYKIGKSIHTIYHLSKIGNKIQATFTPSPTEIPCFLINTNNERVNFNLNELLRTVTEQTDFAKTQLTIIVSGLPEQLESVRKAHKELMEAYMLRFVNVMDKSYMKLNVIRMKKTLGNIIVIDLGSTMHNVIDMMTLNVEKMGRLLGNILIQLTEELDIPSETIHVIGENMGAHVVGVAGRQYNRYTNQRLRRITGLDPFKLIARYNHTLTGLARGDADFVDVIHTSTNGLGMKQRCGDVDFYPNGIEEETANINDNIFENAMLATRLFAESIMPGNEYNFPALTANSFDDYQNYNNAIMKRAYMGINTDFNVKGDYVVEINKNSPFGREIKNSLRKTNPRYLGMNKKIMSFEFMI